MSAEVHDEGRLSLVGEYSRSSGGATVHWEPCSGRAKRTPWNYAARMSVHEVVATAKTHGLTLCRNCWPEQALAESEAEQ